MAIDYYHGTDEVPEAVGQNITVEQASRESGNTLGSWQQHLDMIIKAGLFPESSVTHQGETQMVTPTLRQAVDRSFCLRRPVGWANPSFRPEPVLIQSIEPCCVAF